jgi:outer membrane protein assembly factor BamB
MTAVLIMAGLVASWGELLPTPLETPSFGTERSSRHAGEPALALTGSRPNDVVDYEEWFADKFDWPSITYHNGGVNDAIRGGEPPRGIDRVLRTPGEGRFHLYQIIIGDEAVLAVYGSPPNRFGVVLDPRLLVVLDPETGAVEHVLDFLTYCEGPVYPGLDESVVFQQIRWAEVHDGILYVSNAHRTYAESSRGSNAYITAIDLATYEVLWRSRPLVANAENFLVTGDTIISGYGFTDEDDFLYVLDRRTGEVMYDIEVPSSPEYLYTADGMLYVRCYDTDLAYEFR